MNMTYDPRKISGMSKGKPLEGDEWIEVLQGGLKDGQNVRVQVKELKGETGDAGLSAYDLARTKGFAGSLTEYLDSLHGQDGKKGDKGAGWGSSSDQMSTYE